MAKGLMMLVLSLLFAVGFAVGCGGGNNSGGVTGYSIGEIDVPPETSRANTTTEKTGGTSEIPGGTTASSMTSETESVSLEQISSGTMGPQKRQILLASSAGDLSAAIGLRVPDSGQGTYVAVAWGEKPTGGYTVGLGSAGVDEVRVRVNVGLKPPPPDAMVAQALTYPYAIAVLKGVDLGEKELVFVTPDGQELRWPVINI